MQLDTQVYELINLCLIVIMWTVIISSPFIIVTLEMYGYERYKKYKYKEQKEKEKIIVGKSNKIIEQDTELERQTDQIKRLSLDIELLEKKKNILELNVSDPEKEDPEKEDPEKVDPEKVDPEKVDPEKKSIDDMTILELKAEAKKRGMKLYSRKSKRQLVKMLKN